MCLGQCNRYLPKPAAAVDPQAAVVEGVARGSDAAGNTALAVRLDEGESGLRATSIDERPTSL